MQSAQPSAWHLVSTEIILAIVYEFVANRKNKIKNLKI